MHLLNKENLKECFHKLRRNSGVGIDRVSWLEYEDNLDANLEGLVVRMRKWSYRPQPVRRVLYPKKQWQAKTAWNTVHRG